ncbi:potassium channel family protein [Gracilimonas sp.]|uniref:potassium channel family protein n=1 Tax=Gracilimonas sp. TaxID=1974203 RepID=UPI003BAAB507
MKKEINSRFIILLILTYVSLVLILFYMERNQDGGNIKTIGDTIWYSIVTLTTVGYGDYYPTTSVGKLIGLFLVVSSLGIVGFIFGGLTQKFIEMKERRRLGLNGTDFNNHIVLIGWDNFSSSVAKQLVNSEHSIAVITNNKNHVDLIYQEYSEEEAFVLFTDFSNIDSFEKANISKAFLTLVNLNDDTEKLILILNIKNHFPDMQFLVTLDNSELKETFQSAGVTYVLSKNEISSKLIASYIFEPDVANFTSDLLTSSKKDEDFDIQQFKVIEENPFLGKSYGEAFNLLKEQHNVILIGLTKTEGEQRKLHKLPTDEILIAKNDYLIVIVNGEKESLLSSLFKIKEGITR